MRLLICTQIVDENDPVLGFFHRWIEEFAKHCEQVLVICLQKGTHHLPENVRVVSLGKESGRSRIKYLVRFYRAIWRERAHYDVVFVHMNQIYVLLGGVLWRLWRKCIVLWYVHRSVTVSLRAAVWMVHIIFSTSSESFRINTKKRHYLGHGIDMEQFSMRPPEGDRGLRILTTGRVSSTKRIKEMIEAVSILREQGLNASLTIVGVPVTAKDKSYMDTLPDREYVTFTGAIRHDQIPEVLARHDIFLNLSKTESMDKAVLEALATGMPVVSSNNAFRDMIAPYGLFVSEANPELVADVVVYARTVDVSRLTRDIREQHSLSRLVMKMLAYKQ